MVHTVNILFSEVEVLGSSTLNEDTMHRYYLMILGRIQRYTYPKQKFQRIHEKSHLVFHGFFASTEFPWEQYR